MPSQYDDPGRGDPDERRPRQGPAPVAEKRVYRSNGRTGGGDAGSAGAGTSAYGYRPRRDERRSRMLAVIVLVLVALVIVLIGVAAAGSGSQATDGTFRLLPITTTTS